MRPTLPDALRSLNHHDYTGHSLLRMYMNRLPSPNRVAAGQQWNRPTVGHSNERVGVGVAIRVPEVADAGAPSDQGAGIPPRCYWCCRLSRCRQEYRP